MNKLLLLPALLVFITSGQVYSVGLAPNPNPITPPTGVVQFNPAMETTSGGGPFSTGQPIALRFRVRSTTLSSAAVPLQDIVAVALLDPAVTYSAWSFDGQATGLPQPQVFEQTSGVVIDGKTYNLLRWRWNAGSGNLGINQEVLLSLSTTLTNPSSGTSVRNRALLHYNGGTLTQQCSGSSLTETVDLDNDAVPGETYCYGDGIIPVCQAATPEASGAQVCAGTTVSLFTSTTATALSYQWYKDGVALTSQTSATLTLPNAQTADAGNYRAVVTTACYSLTSGVFVLTVNALNGGVMFTLKTGAWNDVTVWSCNRVPILTDSVQLKHPVTIPASYVAHARQVSFDLGQTLQYSTGGRLLLGH